MAQHGKPWDVCGDCIDPLAGELSSLARRFRIHFNVEKRDRLEDEYRRIEESAGYDRKRLSDDQQRRLDELSRRMQSQIEPPSPRDVDSLYRKYNIDLATDWLKFIVAVHGRVNWCRWN